jgi:CRP/FNR family nitrogen fixation transcriptional regulator
MQTDPDLADRADAGRSSPPQRPMSRFAEPNSHLGSTTDKRDPLRALDPLATTLTYRRGQAICADEGGGDSWYRIVSGVAKRYSERPSGRRQITGLLLPGDLFGFPVQGQMAVEAVVNGTRVACYPSSRVEMLADRDAAIAREIRHLSFEAISRLQEQVLILGRASALKKVGSFLLVTGQRFSDGDARIVLPITRYDIADYLGISIETVSRALSDLKRAQIISFAGSRQIAIVDRDALADELGASGRFDRRRSDPPQPAVPILRPHSE